MARNARLLLLLAAIGVAVVVVGAVVLVGGGGGNGNAATSAPGSDASSATSRVAKRPLLAGIPQRGLTLGRAAAPATLIEFADPQCPYCAQWSNETFPAVVREFVKPGKVRLEFRGLHFLGPDSEKGLRAVLAAGLQNRAWNMIEQLYARQGAENSGWVNDDTLREAGSAAGIDVEKMMAQRYSARVSAQIVANDNLASQLGVRGTPTFALVRPPANPQPLEVGSLLPGDFTATLSAALGA